MYRNLNKPSKTKHQSLSIFLYGQLASTNLDYVMYRANIDHRHIKKFIVDFNSSLGREVIKWGNRYRIPSFEAPPQLNYTFKEGMRRRNKQMVRQSTNVLILYDGSSKPIEPIIRMAKAAGSSIYLFNTRLNRGSGWLHPKLRLAP